jgi:hypothetical protein
LKPERNTAGGYVETTDTQIPAARAQTCGAGCRISGGLAGEPGGIPALPRPSTDEIALNPRHFRAQSTDDVLSTLVHEMHHLAQHRLPQDFGKAGRGGYHNRAFARIMRASGLICSDTGAPGGKETGECMSHYIVSGGAFDLACKELTDCGFSIRYVELVATERRAIRLITSKAASKTRYTCPKCSLHAWAKPAVGILCESCDARLIPDDPPATILGRGSALGEPSRGQKRSDGVDAR